MKNAIAKYKHNNILLIDDNELDNFINEKMIQARSYSRNVYVSTNGKNALEFINNLVASGDTNNEAYPEVIFVDLNMPLMDGFEFIEQFKKIHNPKLMACKIVILTSSISNSDKVKAKELGSMAFVMKPLSNEVLDKL